MPKPEFTITLDEMCRELERELTLREQRYPKLIDAGKLKASQAGRQYARLQASLALLNELHAARAALPESFFRERHLQPFWLV